MVSYQQHIACQHSCHQNFVQDREGMVDPVKIFVTSSSITMRNLVAVSHAGGPKNLRNAEAPYLEMVCK